MFFTLQDQVVPVAGLEPALSFEMQILSLLRLPFRHTGISRNTKVYHYIIESQAFKPHSRR
jgi:hypothetical protein